MAEATRNVERKVVETITVDLSLNEEEAQYLAVVLSFIEGDPTGTRRHGTSVSEALKGAGVDWYDNDMKAEFSGSLRVGK